MDSPAAPAGSHDQNRGLEPVADHVRPSPPCALQPSVHLELWREQAVASAGWGDAEVGERQWRALAPHPEPSESDAGILASVCWLRPLSPAPRAVARVGDVIHKGGEYHNRKLALL